MVPMLLAFAHPCPIPLAHLQYINHNIMMFHDCPQQNKSYLVTWDEDSPHLNNFVLFIKVQQ
jgi:hypothetical protein